MNKLLPSMKFPLIVVLFLFSTIKVQSQNFCASGITVNPVTTQNLCVGTSATPLVATITTSGSGSAGNITFNWYSNATNSTSGGTLVQSSSTTTNTTTNSFTPPSTISGTLWYYVVITNDGGDCSGTSFTSSSVQINVSNLPQGFTVTGGGPRCSNGSLIGVYLSGSETGVNYQLLRDGNAVGSPRAGTGHPMTSLVSSAGTYTIEATSSTGSCTTTMTGSATVTVNPAPSLSYTKTDVSCNGADGSITLTGNGGTPGYMYSISGGSFSSSNTFSGLSSGTYTVAVQDANTCSATTSVNIQTAPPVSVNIVSVNPGDCSGTSGSITATMAGGVNDGVTPIEYKLDGDVTRPYQTSNVFGGLAKGNYTITIKDSKGCTGVSSTITLTQVAGTAPTVFDVGGGGTRCSSGSGVSITLSGSETGVSYQLSKNDLPFGSSVSGTGNPISFAVTDSGTYTIVGTNTTAGCNNIMNGSATVTVNPSPNTFTVSGGGTRCSNGSGIGIYLNGSEPGVNYQLLRNGSPVGTLLAGTGKPLGFLVQIAADYTMLATSTSGNCSTTMTGSATVIVNAAPKIFNVTGGGARCSDTSNISVGINGSESGVNYQLMKGGSPVGTAISGTGSPLTFMVSDTGTYSISAINSTSSCTSNMSGTATITNNPPLTPSFTKYYASSCVGGDGTITVTGNGGTPSYLYNIDGGPFTTNNYFTGLAAGDHNVTVKDANSCTFTIESITVLTAPIMNVTASTIPTGSCTGNDGSITGLYLGGVVDGITPLQYKLDGDTTRPFQISNTFTGLAAGNYTVTIQDSKGCLATSGVISLTTADTLAFTSESYSVNVSSCGNGSDGRIAFGVTGGVAPYHYSLNGSEIGQNQTGFYGFGDLPVGNYTVSISDYHGCSISKEFNISQATAPITTVNYRGDESCIGANDGYVSLSPINNGGIPGYTYSKDGGTTYQSSYSFTNLAPATYSMVVKDSKGCTSSPVSITIKAATKSCRIANSNTSNSLRTASAEESSSSKPILNSTLKIQAYPNPSSSEFTLNVSGNDKDKVSIIVTDILGRRYQTIEGSANQQFKLGRKLKAGVYIVQVMQADKVQKVKIVKE